MQLNEERPQELFLRDVRRVRSRRLSWIFCDVLQITMRWWAADGGVEFWQIAMVVLQARRRSDAVSELCLLSSVELQTIHRFSQLWRRPLYYEGQSWHVHTQVITCSNSNLKGEKLALHPFRRFSEAADISSHFFLNFTDNFHPCQYFREFLFRTWMNQSAICKS